MLSIFLCCIVISVNGQYVSPDEIIKVNELYKAEQYGAFFDKIKNLGFELKESVKDYTLDEVNYKSEFTFNLVTKAPWNKGLTPLANEQTFNTSSWSFIIEEHKLYKRIKISFLIYAFNSEDLFKTLYFRWKNDEDAVDEDFSTLNEKYFSNYSENFGFDVESGDVFELPLKFDAQVEYGKYGPYVRVFLKYNIANHPLNQPIDEYLRNREENKKQSIITVPIINDGKLSKVIVSLGGKPVTYFVDSGASDMNINLSIEKYLKEIGNIRGTDYLSSAKYQLADGSIKEYRRVRLNSVKIGDIIVESVVANITDDKEILLLGKSFFNHFAYWKINNQNHTLELRKWKQ